MLRRVKKRFISGPAGVEPPAGARIRRRKKSKIRGGGGYCAPSAKQRIAPNLLVLIKRNYHSDKNLK